VAEGGLKKYLNLLEEMGLKKEFKPMPLVQGGLRYDMQVSPSDTGKLRLYMGSKRAQIPRGAVVKLVKKIPGRKAIVEYKGKLYICPLRILWKKERDRRGNRIKTNTSQG